MDAKIIILLLFICLFSCNAKKSKITKHTRSWLKKAKKEKPNPDSDTVSLGYKKQMLGLPNNGESLGGEPVGRLGGEDPTGGPGGLGGDMEGVPTGMGAGAEPLGAYNPNEQPQNLEGAGGAPQGLDEGSQGFDGGAMGFVKPSYANGNPNEDFFEGHESPDMNDPPRLKNFAQPNMDPMDTMRQQMEFASNQRQADMSESMTNNLGAMDKANIQGDREVAEMVKHFSSDKAEVNNNEPMDPSVPASNDAAFSPAREENYGENNQFVDSPYARNFRDKMAFNGYNAENDEPGLYQMQGTQPASRRQIPYWNNRPISFNKFSENAEVGRTGADYKDTDEEVEKMNEYEQTFSNSRTMMNSRAPLPGQFTHASIEHYMQPPDQRLMEHPDQRFMQSPDERFIHSPNEPNEPDKEEDLQRPQFMEQNMFSQNLEQQLFEGTDGKAVQKNVLSNFEITAFDQKMLNMAQVGMEKKKKRKRAKTDHSET